MRNDPRDWRIEYLKVVAASYGLGQAQSGRHVTFRHARTGRFNVPSARPILPIYVKRFLQYIDTIQALEE